MEKFHRAKFAANMPQLRNMIDFSSLKPSLAESRLFTEEMLADIEAAGPSDQAKNEELLRCVPKRGPKAHGIFLKALIDTGQVDAARVLDDLIPDNGKWLGHITPARNWPATRQKIYKMTSRPRGVVLIVSNTVFENDVHGQRFGGEVDEHNLQRLFVGLGFDVDLHQNKTREEIMKVLVEFQHDRRHVKANACVVIILSHGKRGGFISADNLIVSNDAILNIFNNVNCAHLRWKPKIFFFVHCRGEEADYAVTHDAFKRSVPDSLPTSFVAEGSLPTFSDVRICYSTCPDFISMRCEVRGTWFISLFVESCAKCAHDTDLDSILRDVSNRLASLESVGGWKQAPEYTERGWRYPLYFNPGLYED